MALTLSFIKLLARAHARQPFQGPILTLGRQGVYATVAQCEEAIRSAGVQPIKLTPEIETRSNVPAFAYGATSDFVSDEALFHMLCGQRPETLDVSDYENADHIHDLNQPAPESLMERYGLIIDGGTMEHVFDVAQTLRNMKLMLRIGGRIFHGNPVNNWADHGFYQFSPTLYHDFYSTNGFEVRDVLILGPSPTDAEALYARPVPVWRWNATRGSMQIVSRQMLSSFIEAEKVADVAYYVPQQGEASAGASSSRLRGEAPARSVLGHLRAGVQRLSPGAAARAARLARRLLRRDLSSPPWGMTFLGRF